MKEKLGTSLFSLGRGANELLCISKVMIPVLISGMELSGGVQSVQGGSSWCSPGCHSCVAAPRTREQSSIALAPGSGAARGGAGGSSGCLGTAPTQGTGDISF